MWFVRRPRHQGHQSGEMQFELGWQITVPDLPSAQPPSGVAIFDAEPVATWLLSHPVPELWSSAAGSGGCFVGESAACRDLKLNLIEIQISGSDGIHQ
jgi:hypothetical protein